MHSRSPWLTQNVTRLSARRASRLAARPRASVARPLGVFRDISGRGFRAEWDVSGTVKATDGSGASRGMRARGISRHAYQLMRAVEPTDADVHDARPRRRRVERHGRLERHTPALHTAVRRGDPGDFGAHRERAPRRVPARAAHHARGEPHRGAQTVRREVHARCSFLKRPRPEAARRRCDKSIPRRHRPFPGFLRGRRTSRAATCRESHCQHARTRGWETPRSVS